jgi:hypothetical protein
MSEYQCYEFVAVDRPLSATQMAELRAISTRAEITSTRFWNEYQWGDLKAAPEKLVERYFDAHAYFANWGSRRLMLRLPLARIDTKQLRAYFPGGAACLSTSGSHVLLDLTSDTEEPEDEFKAGSPLAAFMPVRGDLLRGDLRPAFLAWLLAVQAGDVDDDATEPPVPRGLGSLPASHDALVEFLRIDEHLVAAAAETSAEERDETDDVRAWVAKLTFAAKEEWLQRAVDEPDLPLGVEMRRAFRRQSKTEPQANARTVRDLLAAAEACRERRQAADSTRAERARIATERTRTARLDALAPKLDRAWSDLEALVETSAYDRAIALALDLRDLATRDEKHQAFADRFEAMRKRQSRRRGFFDRWKREIEPRR